MSVKTKEELKLLFETGDKPIASDFIDLIDTLGYTQIDWASPVQVTGATILSIGKHHVCSGTTVNYPVTLPAVSGNAGKLLSVEMSGALTNLVTVGGNVSETIDGEPTRIMWAKEMAILLCNGTQWTKVGGKSIPFIGTISCISMNQLFSVGVYTKIACNTFSGNNHLNAIAVNNTINVPRSNTYNVSFAVRYNSTNTAVGVNMAAMGSESAQTAVVYMYRPASLNTTATGSITIEAVGGSYIGLWGYFTGGSFTTSTVQNAALKQTFLSVHEIPQW